MPRIFAVGQPGVLVDERHLTPAGRELHVLIGVLQQWGDKHLPRPEGPTMVRKARRTERPVHVAFIDDLGYEIPADDVETIPTGN